MFKKLNILVIFLLFIAVFGYNVFNRNKLKYSNIKFGIASNYNIILITIDTLRADHIKTYGYKRITTPSIDKLSKEGVTFSNAYIQLPRTLPSHSCIFTSLYPGNHKVIENGNIVLSREYITLPEVLKHHGYLTAAFVSSWILDSRWGLDQGFDFYDDNDFDTKENSKLDHHMRLKLLTRSAEEVTKSALTWLKKNYSKKIFIWMHYWDPHHPYEPPSLYKSLYLNPSYKGIFDGSLTTIEIFNSRNIIPAPNDIQNMKDLYDGEIRYTDHWIGELIKALKEFSLDKKTLVIITSDHGESFEHNYYGQHAGCLYDSTIKIPLIYWAPNIIKERIISEITESIDIMPSILYLIGVKASKVFLGKNSFLNESRKNKISFAYSSTRDLYFGKGSEAIIAQNNNKKIYKLIIRKDREVLNYLELYNLTDDPKEKENLVDTDRKQAISLYELLQKQTDILGSSKELKINNKIDKETIEKLKSLGYIK